MPGTVVMSVATERKVTVNSAVTFMALSLFFLFGVAVDVGCVDGVDHHLTTPPRLINDASIISKRKKSPIFSPFFLSNPHSTLLMLPTLGEKSLASVSLH